MNIKDALTKKIGPLPAWGWGIVVGVAGLGYKTLRGGGGGQQTQQQLIPTGPMQIDPSAGFLNELSVAIDDIRSKMAATTPGDAKVIVDREWLKNLFQQSQRPPTTTPAPSPSPGGPVPISAKPPTRISVEQAKAALTAIGAPAAWATSGAWIQSSAANYVWASTQAMQDWARRVARTQPAYGYTVNPQGVVVKR